jgi:enamine deaminase RidA (YjgF/YER057c/UK114 family)
MKNLEEKLKSMGLVLPEPSKALGSYVPCVISGNLLFFSGVSPVKNGSVISGCFGESVTLKEAPEIGEAIVLSILSNVKSSLGSLDCIKKFVKIEGYVSSSKNFFDQSKVLNEVSNLIVEIFGESGKHSRIAVGVCSLPLSTAVEVSGVIEIE